MGYGPLTKRGETNSRGVGSRQARGYQGPTEFVRTTSPAQLGMGTCELQVPPKFVVPMVLDEVPWFLWGVDIGWPVHGVFVSMEVKQNSEHT